MAERKTTRDLDDYQRARLDVEWAFLNATREGMNIFRRKPNGTTYKQAMRVGIQIAPELLSEERRIIAEPDESIEARTYRHKAVGETEIRNRIVFPTELVDEDIEELEKQHAANNSELLESRLTMLQRVRQELRPKKFTEHQIIMRDAVKLERYLPFTGESTDHIEYEVGDERRLRVQVLHPNAPETKTGADLIYEIHNRDARTVRVVFLQYKMWERGSLSYDRRMGKQLEKLRGVGCQGQFCLSPAGDHRVGVYRFPYCSAFLRPTDKLQDPDGRLVSSGLHVPLCVVNESWSTTERGTRVLKRSEIKGQSVSHAIFEYLFSCSFIGSRELDWNEMEKYYVNWGLLELGDHIILHAQEFTE
jgi:hypothetical protein